MFQAVPALPFFGHAQCIATVIFKGQRHEKAAIRVCPGTVAELGRCTNATPQPFFFWFVFAYYLDQHGKLFGSRDMLRGIQVSMIPCFFIYIKYLFGQCALILTRANRSQTRRLSRKKDSDDREEKRWPNTNLTITGSLQSPLFVTLVATCKLAGNM